MSGNSTAPHEIFWKLLIHNLYLYLSEGARLRHRANVRLAVFFESRDPGENHAQYEGDEYGYQEAEELRHVPLFKEHRQDGNAGNAVTP
jgi:hypothetical protein